MPQSNQQQDPKVIDAQPDKIRIGASEGLRKNPRPNYNGDEPLEFPGDEEVAVFLATPKSEREFDSISALAEHLNVSRMTIYRRRQDIEVLRRAEFLLTQNKVIGKLNIRREWADITEKLVEQAKSGNVHAVKLCKDLAFPEDRQQERSGLPSCSIEELFGGTENERIEHAVVIPTWARIQDEMLNAAEGKAAEEKRELEKPNDKSE
jgi:HTH domain